MSFGPADKPVNELARWTIEQLNEALRFVDCDTLRQHYTGWIADLRRELARRRSAADSVKPPARRRA